MIAIHTKSINYARGVDFVLSPSTSYELYMLYNSDQSDLIKQITVITKIAMPPNGVSAEKAEFIDTTVPKDIDMFLVENYQLLFSVLVSSNISIDGYYNFAF